MPLQYDGLREKGKLKMGRTLCLLAATILLLIVSIWHSSGALGLNGIASGILDFALIVLLLGSFFGSIISLVYSIAQKKWTGVKTFAAENGFRYEEMPKEETPTLALLFLEKFDASTNFKISGIYGGRSFAVRLVTLSNKSYPPGRGFYGLLGVELNDTHGHVVVDSGDQYWRQENAKPAALMSGRQVYVLDGETGLPSWLSDFIGAQQAGEFAIEIRGNQLFALKKNGFDLTPAGLRRVFELIEKVGVLDK